MKPDFSDAAEKSSTILDFFYHTDLRANLRKFIGTGILLALEAIQPRKFVVKKGFDVRQKNVPEGF